jgi:hypothetical protein
MGGLPALPRHVRVALAGALVLATSGCNLLDVSNTNSVSESALDNPAAAGPIVRGSRATVTRGIGAILTSYATATDELRWVGSRDAYNALDRGSVGDPFNEFVDASFFYVGEARFTADQAIERLVGFGHDTSSRAEDNDLMAEAYLYGAVIYVNIANMFDDWSFSFKMDQQPNIGPSNMIQMFDTAIVYLNKAEALATTDGLLRNILLMRMRAHHDRAVWQSLNPSGVTVTSPLYVNDANANADATAALALIGADDYVFQLDMALDLSDGAVSLGFNVNNRQEMRFGDRFVFPTTSGKSWDSVAIKDPITNAASPIVVDIATEFKDLRDIAPLRQASAREAHLILAEAELASSGANFATHINNLRALDGLPAFSGQVSDFVMLEHSRTTNLFLGGRRLNDIYRFNQAEPLWQSDPTVVDALECRGVLFQITNTERAANTLITGQPACGQ